MAFRAASSRSGRGAVSVVLCGSDRIDASKPYIVLSDLGVEGLTVVSQHDSAHEAVQSMENPGGYSSLVLVKLVQLKFELGVP
jgi:hypothetical protein